MAKTADKQGLTKKRNEGDYHTRQARRRGRWGVASEAALQARPGQAGRTRQRMRAARASQAYFVDYAAACCTL